MKNIIKLAISLLLLFAVSGSLEAKGEKTVAVLPFTVHSAENIDYVRQGIWDMLSSRITVIEKIEVLSKEIVIQAMKEKEGKDLALADVYSLGKKMNVDFVVFGSITKIGNSMSIDGKLIDIAANKSTVTIFTQTQGMDEVILKINDFARNIDNHILGMVPSTFTSASAPPQAAASQQQTPQNVRESEMIAGMKTSKRGTFTSIINPDFINAARPLDRKGFWMSQKFPIEFTGMDIGDVTGDGLNKVVIIDSHNVMVYQKKDSDFNLIYKIPGRSHEKYIAVDVADINKNGIKEIIVTSLVRNTVESFVLEYKDGKFVKIASKLPWFLRIIDTASGPLLLGQRRGFDKPFSNPIYEIVWEDGQYKAGKKMKIPEGLSVYGLTIDNLGTSGGEKIIALDDYDYLNLYEQTDKPLARLQTFGGNDERIWKSDDVYGGSNTAVENTDLKIDAEDKYTYINLRILTFDTNKDGKKEVIIVKNLSSTARLFKNIKLFTSSEVYNLEWDGLGLVENWKTRKINGYVADYQFKDIDNDGQNEIVLALILSTGASVSDKSVIVSYKMIPQQNP
ncbi:MAG: FG-GAP-like repeat-containing protein [Deltaproteobacteria bacterium]|nr:FG-GAP-like repeat-containing protein [Deltaproteobacteria bacterium]